jgi:SAM-dependent methyltransferase
MRLKFRNEYVGRLIQIKIYEAMYRPLRSRTLRQYVGSDGLRKVQLGTGPNTLPGWLNTDVYPAAGFLDGFRSIGFLDVKRRFPFDAQTIDYIFSEHVVEHLSHNQAIHMLSECYRVLRPGGKMRIATPDLHAIMSLAGCQLSAEQQAYVDFVARDFLTEIEADGAPPPVLSRGSFAVNLMFYGHGHRFLYDEQTLRAALEHAGFTHVVRRDPGASDDPVLRNLERHGSAIGDEAANRFETMALEATRPA